MDPEFRELIADVKLEFARNREESARGREQAERNQKEFERNREEHERSRAFLDDLSEKLRLDNERLDRKADQVIAENHRGFNAMIEELHEMRREGREHTDAVVTELKDLRDESRAQREALLKLIDRLPPPPGDPSEN